MDANFSYVSGCLRNASALDCNPETGECEEFTFAIDNTGGRLFREWVCDLLTAKNGESWLMIDFTEHLHRVY